MNRKESSGGGGGRQGFTLAEMIVAILAAAILALTAGAVFVSSFKGWLNVSRAVDMQRDAYAALDSLSRAVHMGTNMTFVTGTVFTVQYGDRPNSQFYRSGGDFIAVSPPGATGVTVRLVYGKLKTFTVSVVSNPATVWLVLTNGTEMSSNQVTLARRN